MQTAVKRSLNILRQSLWPTPSGQIAENSEHRVTRSLLINRTGRWYPVRLLGLYRLFIGVLLASLFFTNIASTVLGQRQPMLFTICIVIYLCLAILWMVLANLRRPNYTMQVAAQITTDMLLLILMTHTSGGLNSGLGILMVVNVGSAALLLDRMAGFFFAALGAILVLLQQSYTYLSIGTGSSTYSQAGALGATFFAIAALILVLKQRVRISEQLIEQQELDIANLAELNEQIIQQMQSGVLVVDQQNQVRFINRAARLQLNSADVQPPVPMPQLSPELDVRYHLWRNSPQQKAQRIRLLGSPFELQPNFNPLGQSGNAGTLVILEDTTPYSREFQNIKLASLGRLTASIAHEIRNPLSAVQHASQLLAETRGLDDGSKRLTQIINQQTERMNAIIENVMQLSIKEKTQPTQISVDQWLSDFDKDFRTSLNDKKQQLQITLDKPEMQVYFDPSQLHQIIWNLCSNSLKYGEDLEGYVFINILAGYSQQHQAPFLEIMDTGLGIPRDIQDQIFEPFYSSSNNSPGLGLYIVRELCEFNHAQINYVDRPGNGAVFRIQFPNAIELGMQQRQIV